MIIVMRAGAGEPESADMSRRIQEMGYHPHVSRGEARTIIEAIGDDRGKERLQSLE